MDTKSTDHNNSPKILLLEPFYGGSHKQLIDILYSELGEKHCTLVTMSAKKWHWRARTSALTMSELIPLEHNFSELFASSVLNLAELIALRQDLQTLHKIIYFHENQLIYPVRNEKERDFQYGYNQILTCLTADVIVFNSHFNMNSFLDSISRHMKLMPDYRPKDLSQRISVKCKVLYFPILIEPSLTDLPSKTGVIKMLWPHRWEHDKNPEVFFETMLTLLHEGKDFRISVLGESFSEVPEIFEKAKVLLSSKIDNWGYLQDKKDYYNVLMSSDIVVSTALHEFFGVAMLEAVCLGCYPICPNRLSYPELFPTDSLYNTNNQLLKSLRKFCDRPELIRQKNINRSCYQNKFLWNNIKDQYMDIICKRVYT